MNFRDSIRMHRLAVMRRRRALAEQRAKAAACSCLLCRSGGARSLGDVMREIAASSLGIETPPEAKH